MNRGIYLAPSSSLHLQAAPQGHADPRMPARAAEADRWVVLLFDASGVAVLDNMRCMSGLQGSSQKRAADEIFCVTLTAHMIGVQAIFL